MKINNRKRNEILQLSNYELDKAVKIAGTQFDRRNKLSPALINKLKKLRKNGLSWNKLAMIFNITPPTARYHCDPEYKQYTNGMRSVYAHNTAGNHKNRRAYKRTLLENKLI